MAGGCKKCILPLLCEPFDADNNINIVNQGN